MVKNRWSLVDADCLDVSASGLLIKAGQEFTKGDVVEVALELPDGTKLHCVGRVVREEAKPGLDWEGKGYGIQIDSIDDAALSRLKSWLGTLAGTAPQANPRPSISVPPSPNPDRRPPRRSPARLEATDTVPATPGRPARPSRRKKHISPQELHRALLRLKRRRNKR